MDFLLIVNEQEMVLQWHSKFTTPINFVNTFNPLSLLEEVARLKGS